MRGERTARSAHDIEDRSTWPVLSNTPLQEGYNRAELCKHPAKTAEDDRWSGRQRFADLFVNCSHFRSRKEKEEVNPLSVFPEPT